MNSMSTASAAGATAEVSAQGQAETTSITKSKEEGEVSAPSHLSTLPHHC